MKREAALRYTSRSRQLRAESIDAYVRETIAELRTRFEATGSPFALYRGCSKEDEQIVEVCLPTATGEHELPPQVLAYTVARGSECDYPAILHAYDAVVEYARANGHELAGPPRETYLTDPATEPQMEVAFPLAVLQ